MGTRKFTFWYATIALSGVVLATCALCYGRFWRQPSIAELQENCRAAMEAKDWRQFESTAVRWAAVAPESGEPWLQLAEAQRRQHKYQIALACLDRIPPASAEWEAGLLAQMELQFGPLNRPADGAETCERILAKNPQSSVARQRLLFFLAFTLQRTRMVQEIRAAIETGNEPIESYVYFFFADSLLFTNGVELNGRWLKGEPGSELYTVAEAVFTAESLDLSVLLDDRDAALFTRRAAARKASVMEKLLAKYPHNTELLAYNIRQHIQTGDIARVVQLLAQATVECEVDHRFWRFKGWVHAQRHQDAEAENSYRRAIKLHPLDWSTRNMLAELLQQQERFEEVKAERQLVARGNELHRELRHAPNTKQVPNELLKSIADYAKECGEVQISDGLSKRLQENTKT